MTGPDCVLIRVKDLFIQNPSLFDYGPWSPLLVPGSLFPLTFPGTSLGVN